jgi:hypothetical protein
MAYGGDWGAYYQGKAQGEATEKARRKLEYMQKNKNVISRQFPYPYQDLIKISKQVQTDINLVKQKKFSNSNCTSFLQFTKQKVKNVENYLNLSLEVNCIYKHGAQYLELQKKFRAYKKEINELLGHQSPPSPSGCHKILKMHETFLMFKQNNQPMQGVNINNKRRRSNIPNRQSLPFFQVTLNPFDNQQKKFDLLNRKFNM